MRSENGGAHVRVRSASRRSQPRAAWAALCVCPDGSLLAASFRTSDTGGSQVWRITNPRGRPPWRSTAAAPAVVEDIAVVDGVVYAACGTFGLYRVDPGARLDAARAGDVPAAATSRPSPATAACSGSATASA